MKKLLLIALLFVAGCTAATPTTPDSVDINSPVSTGGLTLPTWLTNITGSLSGSTITTGLILAALAAQFGAPLVKKGLPAISNLISKIKTPVVTPVVTPTPIPTTKPTVHDKIDAWLLIRHLPEVVGNADAVTSADMVLTTIIKAEGQNVPK